MTPKTDSEKNDTHFNGCWMVHHGCAIERIKKLEAEREQVRSALHGARGHVMGMMGQYESSLKLLEAEI